MLVIPRRSRRSRRSRPPLAVAGVVVAALLALAACTSTVSGQGTVAGRTTPSAGAGNSGGSSASALPSAPAQAKADFSDCRNIFNLGSVSFPSGRESRLSFDCASLKVPLDYTHPTDRSITVEIVRIHDSQSTGQKPLLVNPGGPGASGIELAVGLAAQVSDKLLERYDILGFDPRGVGLSTPIRCLSNSQKDQLNAASPNVLTSSGRTQAKKNAKMVATLCEQKYGSALPFFNTVNTARDIDRIRQALGQSSTDYLGFSYGTELGSTYAHLYPKNVGVMVLDGAVDPLTDDITSFADQLQGFEDAFDQFAKYCVITSPCSTIGNPRQAVYKIAAAATKSPLPVQNDSRTATSSVVYNGVLEALYSRSYWPGLGQALVAGLKGDGTQFQAFADQYNQRYSGQYSNLSDANNAIGCNDSKLGPSDATILSTAKQWKTRFPIFGLWSAPSLYSCQQWQQDRTPPPLPTATSTPKKVLVIGNTHDPATPYQGAKDLAKTMGNTELLSWDGQGHTSYLQGSTCVDKYVNNFLVGGTLPPDNTTCPA